MNELTWHVAPVDQGQMIEVAYAADGENARIVRRTTDRADGSVSYEQADVAALHGDFAPWNGAPEIPTRAWRAVQS